MSKRTEMQDLEPVNCSSLPWLAPPDVLILQTDEIHVWRASLDLPDSQIEMLAGILSPDEVNRSEKYHFRRDQKNFIVARGILRNILARYLAAEPEQIVLSNNSHGKPFLCDPFNSKELSFNLSHTRDLALYAVTVKRRVGIDLESVQQEFQWREIVERFFSSGEQAALWALPEKERCSAFFTYWTRKEAVIKAIGTGLTDDIREINVVSNPLRSACLSKTGERRSMSDIWELINLDPGPGFAGALAVDGEGLRIQRWQWC